MLLRLFWMVFPKRELLFSPVFTITSLSPWLPLFRVLAIPLIPQRTLSEEVVATVHTYATPLTVNTAQLRPRLA